MIKGIRKRLTYTNVAMTIALIFAMSGGAYAASKYVITSTKQISPKVLAALKGKAGKPGAAGPAGAQGPAGPAGGVGPTGPQGVPGEKGTDGGPGESVTATSLAVKNAHCEEGGSEFTTGGKHTYACTGSPWPAGGTLPAGKSESGAWSTIYEATAAKQPGSSAISFGIPLKSEPELHFIGTNEELAGEPHEAAAIKEHKCSGSSEEPEAAPGNLCVFARLAVNTTEYLLLGFEPTHFVNPGRSGVSVVSASEAAGEVLTAGAWVVTAPTS